MFSVVVPVFNKAPMIRRTVESVLAQTWRDFELILVDDGSTDGSLERLAGLDDDRIRVLTQVRQGAGAARNAGMAAARHDWIAFLDADDLWLPNHLEVLDAVRRRHPEAGLVGASFVQVRDPEAPLPPQPAPEIGLVSYFAAVASDRQVLCASSAAISRRAYEAVGEFGRFPMGQDSEYWARIALCLPVAASTEVTALYVRGTGGITDQTYERWAGGRLRTAHDLSPAVSLVLQRYAAIGSAELRRDIDRFVDHYLHWCLTRLVELGDVATLRRLPGLYRLAPTTADRTLLRLARLPAPIARWAFKAQPWAQARLTRAGPGTHP